MIISLPISLRNICVKQNKTSISLNCCHSKKMKKRSENGSKIGQLRHLLIPMLIVMRFITLTDSRRHYRCRKITSMRINWIQSSRSVHGSNTINISIRTSISKSILFARPMIIVSSKKVCKIIFHRQRNNFCSTIFLQFVYEL